MLRQKLLSTTIFTTAVLAAQAATADVTAADVWANMSAYEAATGGQTIGTETVSGDTLTITERAILYRFPLDAGTMRFTMPDTTLTTNADGTVTMAYPDTFEMLMDLAIPSEDVAVSATLAVSQRDFAATASGTADAVTYDISASSIAMALLNVDFPDFDGDLSFQFEAAGYTLTETVTLGQLLTSSNAMTIAPSTGAFSADDGFGGTSTNTVSYGETTSEAAFALPLGGFDLMNISAALTDGLSLTGKSTTASSQQDTRQTLDGEVVVEQVINSGPGVSEFSISEDGFDVRFDAGRLDVNMLMADVMPFPIAGVLESASAKIAFPLLPSDTAQDFTYSFALNNMTISDDLWNLFDAGQSLTRDPVSIAVDVSGAVLNGIDFLNFYTIEDQMDQAMPPISLESLTINELSAAALGASAIASGAFILDNTDMSTFDGFPAPEGSAIMRVEGANAVLDQLSAAGLLGPDEATAARFGMAFIGRSTGDDAFESQLDVNADGHVSVNGQRMR